METTTKPCEACGAQTTKTPEQWKRRLYWTCSKKCAVQMAIRSGNRVAQANRFSGLRETRPCGVCGKPITRYVTEQNHAQVWKCSRACSASSQVGATRSRKGDTINCAQCGRSFYREPAQVHRNQAFCSDDCAHKGRRVQKITKACGWCGKEFLAYPAQAESRRFCSRACTTPGKVSRPAGRMHNGKPVRYTADGYLLVWEPTHPRNRKGWVLEHRWVMEQQLGRYLEPTEEVDHSNQKPDDNRPENLSVMLKGDHRRKTGADARRNRMTMRDRLAAYEAKYGPLD